MRTRVFLLTLVLFVFTLSIFAQETTTETQPIPQPAPPTGMPSGRSIEMTPGMPRMNPTMLLRMRNQMAFELQEIQRIVGLVDPGDKQLLDMHKERQKEIVDQLKDIETQLKAQGVPVEDGATGVPTNLGAIPPRQDPTLVPGGIPQPPTDPNLLIQQRQTGTPTMQPPFQMMNPVMPPQTIPGVDPLTLGVQPTPPTGYDQDQAWNNSPWVPQPSKELSEMKQTVEALRQEIGELKATVKALETQIQLLNRNILLSQPQTPANP